MQKTFLAIACALLLACGALVTWLTATDAAPPVNAAARDAVAQPASLTTGDTTSPRDDHAAAATVVAERTTAAAAHTNARPFDDDAEWLVVTVVDKETKAPAPGAIVRWYDESAWTFLDEQGTLREPERALLMQDGERLADVAGWRATADGGGQVRVTVTESTTVLAELGEKFGTLQLRTNTLAPDGGHRVELEPDRAVEVRVVDEGGGPCGGVLVALAASDEQKNVVDPARLRLGRTDAVHGTATLRHLQLVARDLLAAAGNEKARDEMAGRLRVFAVIAATHVPGDQLSLAAPPEEPLVVRLPACGSVRVRGEFAGRPIPGFDRASAFLYLQQQQQQVESFGTSIDEDGWARFPRVPLGVSLGAWISEFGGMWREFAGPAAPGQQIDAVLSPADAVIVLRGRFLDLGRQPLANVALQVRADGPEWSSEATTKTDADGRFSVSLGEPGDDTRVDHLWLDCTRRRQAPLRAVLAGRTLRSGVEELGDVMSAELPLIVGGRVEGASPRTNEHLWLRVEHQVAAEGTQPARWDGLDNVLAHVDAGGTFTIRGDAAQGDHRLTIGGDRVLPIAPIVFRPGRADLVIALDSGVPLAASLLLPAKAPADSLRAELLPAAKSEAPPELKDRLAASPESVDGERRQVRWQTVPPGAYTLELRLLAAGPVLRIADVVVPGPAGGDPRLRDIDLRPLVRTATLHVHNAAGEVLERVSGAVFFGAAAQEKEPRAFGLSGNATALLLPAGPTELLVCVHGYRPKPCSATADRIDVRVDPWPTIQVELADMPPLPKKVDARIRLTPVTPIPGRYATQYDRGAMSQLFAAPLRRQRLTDGKAELAIGDGEHTLDVTLMNQESGQRRTIKIKQPATVLSTSGRVIARVPAAEWQQAIDAVKAPPK